MPINPLDRVWNSSAVRRFVIQAGLVILLFTTVAVVGIHLRTERLIMSGVRQQADSYLDLVVVARAWNAMHGGVWVTRDKESPTNPFLVELGVDPDTSTVSGTVLTLRNPAAMTRELSELVPDSEGVRFNLTSLDPVNPGNAPDAWETSALREFQRGGRVAETIETRDGHRVYRRMRPLVTRESCLRCHRVQGYVVGDIRGALSVSVDLTANDAEARRNAWSLGALWVSVVGVLGFTVYGLVFRMAARIDKGESRLRVLATTDELTDLANRRTTIDHLKAELSRAAREHSRVGVIELDIDHFKAVNDTHGHAAGDAVLKAAAHAMRDAVRPYDVVGRIGGEEFLVLTPDIREPELIALAERIRAHVAAEAVTTTQGVSVSVTVSAGCTLSTSGESSHDEVLARADRALYLAKTKGRNRVEVG